MKDMNWVPLLALAVSILNILLLPALKVLIRAEIVEITAKHNDDPNAHPDLKHFAKLEAKLDRMTDKLDEVREAVGKITPRRRSEDCPIADGGI